MANKKDILSNLECALISLLEALEFLNEESNYYIYTECSDLFTDQELLLLHEILGWSKRLHCETEFYEKQVLNVHINRGF